MAAELGHLARAAATILSLLIFHVAPYDSRAQARVAGGTGTCISRERDALLSFKASLLCHLSSWDGEDCCQWEGVQCSSRTGHVIKLNLLNTRDYDNSLSLSKDELSSSLAALQQLRYLDLSGNDFAGASIPVFMGSLEKLRYLDLSSSGFRGIILSQLGNLSHLKYLDVFGGISNDPHVVDLAWLSLNLSLVRDWVYMVNMLSSLRVLRLEDCGFTSTMSTTLKSNLTRLQVLDLSANLFNTSLEHNRFWDLTSLKEFHLFSGDWHGPIPEKLGNMTSLEVIDLSENHHVGLIPSNLENLCNLEVLHFNDNWYMNMTIGEFMNRLSTCSWSTIQVLSVVDTSLTGKLPIWIGNMTSLSILSIGRNMITGTVPLGVGELGNLTVLDLSYNKLDVVLTKDHFSGLLKLGNLDLSDNSLKMDTEPNWVPPFKLKYLDLQSCSVGHRFPQWLRSQTDIDYLVLGNTSLDDVIPDWFWVTFSRDLVLDASRNMLHGSLPTNLQHMSASIIYLGSNKLTGQVPRLSPINISHMDMSSNSLGSLPAELKAPQLAVLLLENNQIIGTISSSLCQLTSLGRLDLSGNNLTGDVIQCSVQAL
ncbi:hypothetical protein VPH35_070952 [Triticum aestivum]